MVIADVRVIDPLLHIIADEFQVGVGSAAVFGRVVDNFGYVPYFILAGLAIAFLSLWLVQQKKNQMEKQRSCPQTLPKALQALDIFSLDPHTLIPLHPYFKPEE